VRLELFDDRSAKYPAWEVRWEDLERGPRAAFERVARREVVESGPVRAALEIERTAAGSRVVERWSLAAGGAGDRLECAVALDWRTPSTLAKAAYRFAGECPEAAYDTGLGAIRRPVSSSDLYEVPAQLWAALDDPARGLGLAVLSDLKSGWDHPDPSTLRLTWMHAPRASFKWRHQRTQDFGRHRFRIALAPFAGDPVDAGVPALADRFANPLLAFPLEPGGPREPGGSPDRFELLSVEGRGGLVQALKPEDDGERLVLRLRNPAASAAAVRVRGAAASLESAVELDGREREPGEGRPLARAADGSIEVAVPPGGLATLGLALAEPAGGSTRLLAPRFEVLSFPGRLCLSAARGQRAPSGGFDGRGRTFPRELVPERIQDATVPFDLTHVRDGATGVLEPCGEGLEIPGGFVELWLLAAASGGELDAAFALEGGPQAPALIRLRVPDWRAPLFVESRFRPRLAGGQRVDEVVRRVPIAFATPFLRDRRGRDLVAEPGLLFALRVPLGGARRVRLPSEPRLRLVAATLADRPARPLSEGSSLLR
jgi:alpha-mannosidase